MLTIDSMIIVCECTVTITAGHAVMQKVGSKTENGIAIDYRNALASLGIVAGYEFAMSPIHKLFHNRYQNAGLSVDVSAKNLSRPKIDWRCNW